MSYLKDLKLTKTNLKKKKEAEEMRKKTENFFNKISFSEENENKIDEVEFGGVLYNLKS